MTTKDVKSTVNKTQKAEELHDSELEMVQGGQGKADLGEGNFQKKSNSESVKGVIIGRGGQE